MTSRAETVDRRFITTGDFVHWSFLPLTIKKYCYYSRYYIFCDMFRPSRLVIVLIAAVLIVSSSCSERACTVKLNKKKFNYYNGLQYGRTKK
jgi:hypothetical protein